MLNGWNDPAKSLVPWAGMASVFVIELFVLWLVL